MSNDLNKYGLTLAQATPLVEITLKAGLVPFLKSAPGIGKSSLAKQIADANNWCFMGRYVATYDPTDFNGLPFKAANDRTGFLPPNQFPLEGKDELPFNPELVAKAKAHNDRVQNEGLNEPLMDLESDDLRYSGFLILLDELPSAPDSVQVACYRFILEKEVGDEMLHSKAHVMAAGNGIEHGAIASEFGTAMKSRVVTYNIKACHKAFIEWGLNNGIDSRITNFAQLKPESVNSFNPDCPEDAFSCSRTLEFLNRQLAFIDDPAHRKYIPLYAGTIGSEHATNFWSFMKVYGQVATFDEILAAPDTVNIKDEPQYQMAIADIAQNGLTVDNIAELMPFFYRLSPELRVVALRRAFIRDRDLTTTPEATQASIEIAQLIM